MQNVFHAHLKNLNYFSMFIKLIDTIVVFVLAQLLAKIVNYASSGDVSLVLQSSLVLLLFLFIFKVTQIILTLKYETLKSAAIHRCKQSLYQILLSNPLHILYAQEHGSSMEKLNHDFDITIERTLALYPNLWINILSAAAYFLFLAGQNLFLATSLLIISFIQIIPPVIVKNFMQINYDNCRNIEAQITDFTISSYRGFAAIKLYQLKDWWQKNWLSITRNMPKSETPAFIRLLLKMS